MAKKQDVIIATGEVLETLPIAMFRIKLDDTGHEVLGVVAGRMRKRYVRILPGDKVDIEFSPYDLERGRVVYRHKK